jgi:hypothetical protein
MGIVYPSKLQSVSGTNKDYCYQKMTNGRECGQYILYVKKIPYVIRKKVGEIKEFARAHYETRKSCNFNEPKYELNFFDPLERRGHEHT